ncbi:cytochrome P450 [Dendrothele bispora CBS 962.96]|uniref:Cytochrome P450 n=1 Tax=Dendrothele bispora (strain CBS 962.96) TaxID=1314807 RepID=A0A4S8M8Z1_DENBC|nr:cytochrome P450 [Dendrothele bispora CBS 962.96]
MGLISANVLIGLVCAVVVYYAFSKRSRSAFPLPPGPRRLPIVGNWQDTHKLTEPIYLVYTKWAKEFGDLVYLEMPFGESTIVVNSAKAVDELFEKRSANYSDRPKMYMANELMKWAWNLAHMRYSDRWRLHRKTFHQYFQQRQIPEFYPIQRESATLFLNKLIEDPEEFHDHVRHHAGYAILKAVYGHKMARKNDYYVHLADLAVRSVAEALDGSFLVDYVPMLAYIPSWFPGASFKRKAKLWGQHSLEAKDGPWVDLKRNYENGTGVPCFAIDSLEKFKDSKEMEEVIKNCAGIAFVAGADTTVSLILSAILALLVYPDVQAKVQAEIDAVVGNSRLPDFEDREKLPYLEAVLTETLRWIPVLPLSLPHRVVKDDIYEGHFIPGGSIIIGNTWNILRDPEMYPDPDSFKPERFLQQPGKKLPLHPAQFAFGFGRRVCPGRYFGLSSAWIAIASLVATCNINKAVDSNGKVIEPVVDIVGEVVCHPAPFKCSFVPRSPEALKLMKAGYENST